MKIEQNQPLPLQPGLDAPVAAAADQPDPVATDRAYVAKATGRSPSGEAELSDAHTTAAPGGQRKDEGDEPDR